MALIPRRALTLALAARGVAVAAVSVARPNMVAQTLGVGVGEVRAVGLRDAAVTVGLLGRHPERGAVAARLLCDVRDTLRYGTKNPAVAAAGVGIVVVGVAALIKR